MNTIKTLITSTLGFLVFLIPGIAISDTWIPEKPLIISRESWQANTLYNDREGQYWEEILENRRKNHELHEGHAHDQTKIQEQQQKTEEIEEYLYGNFLDQFSSVETIYYDPQTGNKLAWPLKYTNTIDAIIVHHTHSEYDTGIEGMQKTHKYHSLSNQWGDIGYNYLIGYDGEIYEGRDGGDYVVGAHSSYNNFGTVGIAVIGDYHYKPINEKQYASLESLIQYLTYHYGIDLSKKRYYHMNCSGEKCNTFHLETYLDSVLSGHRDTGHTHCPGDELYEQIQQIRADNLAFTQGFTPKKREEQATQKEHNEGVFQASLIHEFRKKLQKYDINTLLFIQKKLDILIKNDGLSKKKQNTIKILKLAILLELQD